MSSSALARAIREARLDLRLTQEQLGNRVGVKSRAVYRWESGRSQPRKLQRSRLVAELQRFDARAAERVRQALASLGGAPQAAPPPPPPPPDPRALERAVYAMADELDLAPRRLRAALARMLERAAQAHYGLPQAHAAIAALEASSSALREVG